MGDVGYEQLPPSYIPSSPVFTRVVPIASRIDSLAGDCEDQLSCPPGYTTEWFYSPSGKDYKSQPADSDAILAPPPPPPGDAVPLKTYPPQTLDSSAGGKNINNNAQGNAKFLNHPPTTIFTITTLPARATYDPYVISEARTQIFTLVQPFASPDSFRNVEEKGVSSSSKYVAPPGEATPPRDVPDEDVELRSPPVELMEKVDGYENLTFELTDVPPPPPEEVDKTEQQRRTSIPSLTHFTEEEVRTALMEYVRKHCCFVQTVAQDMTVTNMEHLPAFHYTLESFTERRQAAWAFEPYTGGTLDSPSITDVPTPWEVCVYPSSYFHNHASNAEVPHTASVRACHACGGVGRKRCTACSANGWENCYYCHGDGQRFSLQGEREKCFQCQGSGKKKCWKCNGEGIAACRSCGGTGQIRCFITVTVTWTNHVDEHVVEQTVDLGEKVESASGKIVLEEERRTVSPLTDFPDTSINQASAQFVKQHSMAFPMERTLMQRHRVRIIPITSVSYEYKHHTGLYYVYGTEKKVYAPDYPQACCCAII